MQSSENMTTTEKWVYASMQEFRQNGVPKLTKRQIAEATGAHEQTVHQCLKRFVAEDWVEAEASVSPTGCHNATIYRLTSAAPGFSELLSIGAVR